MAACDSGVPSSTTLLQCEMRVVVRRMTGATAERFDIHDRGLLKEGMAADVVVFAGNVPESELADHYRLGDVFVMANRALPNGDTEGFGLVRPLARSARSSARSMWSTSSHREPEIQERATTGQA